jgi:two-component system chemotaxis sensor kinase CheA
MKFKTKLYAGFGFIIGLAIIFFLIVVSMLNEQNDNMSKVINNHYGKIEQANKIRHEMGSIGRQVNQLVFSADSSLNGESIDMIQTIHFQVKDLINNLESEVRSDQAANILITIEQNFLSYSAALNKLIASYESGTADQYTSLLMDAERQRSSIISDIEDFIITQEQIMEDILQASKASYENVMQLTIAISILALLLSVVFAGWIIRSVVGSLNRIKKVMLNLQFGSGQFPRLEVKAADEIGAISAAFNKMLEYIEAHEKSERIYKTSIEEDRWLKSKVAELSALSQGILDLDVLADKYINALTPVAGALYGMIYYKANQGKEIQFTKLSAYAFSGQSTEVGRSTIRLGEGLVGQCALENKEIYIERVPADYLNIASGMGNSNPASVLILPVSFEGEVIAVIELASFDQFNALQRSFVSQAVNHLGISLNRIQKHMQVEELLRETQAFNEELQTQSEELQQQQEELKTMNDELEAQNHISEQKTRDLEAIRLELEDNTRQVELGSKYKSEFLANMSHELRTPLNSLLILSQMLKDNKDGNLTEKQLEYAGTIHSSGNELLQMINDILDLSKIESGKMDIQASRVVIGDIISYVEQQFRHVAKQKDIKFVVNADDDLPPSILSDELRLCQVLKNLLSNAFKFTEYGTVEMRIHKAIMKDRLHLVDQRALAFSIKDTGIGIPQDKQQMIFGAFNQADGTTSRKFGGSGLGLSICRELADLLGGYIEVQSEEGIGSVFTLYLSTVEKQSLDEMNTAKEIAASSEAADKQTLSISNSEASTKAGLEGKTILVVDDDMRNVFALTSALEAEKVRVEFAENGKEAIERLKRDQDIDLVLMDIMMPEMDGYEAMRAIRDLPEYLTLPIIALTAKAMKTDRQKCIDAGASDYISKPVNIEQLFTLIRVWLYK